MTIEDLVRYFIEASISGASKTQVERRFKETYNLNDDQIKKLQILSKFKNKPKKINYKEFYRNILLRKLKEFIIHLLKYINKKISYLQMSVIN